MTIEQPAGPLHLTARFLAVRPDFIILGLALPTFIVFGWPLIAWIAVAAIWTVQFGVQLVLDRKAAASDDPKRVMSYYMGGALGRAWSVATVLLVVGLVDRPAAIYAIALTAVVFTTYFVARVINRLAGEAETVMEAERK